jgi:hypothetical protein
MPDKTSPETCAACGHQHTGKAWAYICIGCPCPKTPGKLVALVGAEIAANANSSPRLLSPEQLADIKARAMWPTPDVDADDGPTCASCDALVTVDNGCVWNNGEDLCHGCEQEELDRARNDIPKLLAHIEALDAATVPVTKYAELCAHHARHHEEDELRAPIRRALAELERLVRRFEKEPQGVGLDAVEQAMFAKLRYLEHCRHIEEANRSAEERTLADPSEELLGKWATSMQGEPFDSPVRAIGEVTLILLRRLASAREELSEAKSAEGPCGKFALQMRDERDSARAELAECKGERDAANVMADIAESGNSLARITELVIKPRP